MNAARKVRSAIEWLALGSAYFWISPIKISERLCFGCWRGGKNHYTRVRFGFLAPGEQKRSFLRSSNRWLPDPGFGMRRGSVAVRRGAIGIISPCFRFGKLSRVRGPVKMDSHVVEPVGRRTARTRLNAEGGKAEGGGEKNAELPGGGKCSVLYRSLLQLPRRWEAALMMQMCKPVQEALSAAQILNSADASEPSRSRRCSLLFFFFCFFLVIVEVIEDHIGKKKKEEKRLQSCTIIKALV